MEWIGLVIWIIVVVFALPLGRHGHSQPFSLGVQVLAAVAGLGLYIVFLVLGDPAALAWGATALGVVSTASILVAVTWLISDDRPISHAGQGAEETCALLAGVELPLFALATGSAALIALDVGIGELTWPR